MAQTEDQAVAWLESVAMRPMLEALLENVCKDKPDHLLNYSISWMRATYADLAMEAAAAEEADGDWATRADVEPTPEGLMAYLKEIDATTILEATIERAIRAQPPNVVAYVIDEFAGLRANPTGQVAAVAADVPSTPGGAVVSSAATAAAQGHHPLSKDLMDSIGDGDVERVEELLRAGVPADCKDAAGGKTALIAAAEGEEECLRLLLSHGAMVDFQSKSGETALMAAVKYSDASIVRILLEAGADPLLKDIKGVSATDLAASEEEILELLDPAKAEAAKAAKKGATPKKGVAPRRGSVSSESIDPKKQTDLSKIPQVPKSDDVIAHIESCIQGHLLFRELDRDTRSALILSMTEVKVAEGETIIAQGDKSADFFYVVDSGGFECYVKAEGVEPPGKHVMTYSSGDNFGELALMYNTPRAATIIASQPSVLWAIEREVFRTLILSRYMLKRTHFEKILETVPLLQSMNQYERTVLADAFEETSFGAGDEIIHEGASGDAFYILLEGECSATQTDASSTTHEVKHYAAGEYFGELALIRDSYRQASVRAVTDCKVIALDKVAFEKLLGPVKEVLAADADKYPPHL